MLPPPTWVQHRHRLGHLHQRLIERVRLRRLRRDWRWVLSLCRQLSEEMGESTLLVGTVRHGRLCDWERPAHRGGERAS